MEAMDKITLLFMIIQTCGMLLALYLQYNAVKVIKDSFIIWMLKPALIMIICYIFIYCILEEGNKEKTKADQRVENEVNEMQKKAAENNIPVEYEKENTGLKIYTKSGTVFYSLGEYEISNKNPEAINTLQIIEEPIDKLLDNSKDNNAIIKIEAIGLADGHLPENNSIYQGKNTPLIKYYKSADINREYPQHKTFIRGRTKMENIDYAILRAYHVVEYFKNKKQFRDKINDENIVIFAAETDQKGLKYRRCDFSITLEGYFSKDYGGLSWFYMN